MSVIEELKGIVGPKGWLEAPDETAPYLVDERALYRGATPLVVRPASAEQVAAVLALCSREGVGVVPQGGNTGYVGGAVPDGSGQQILLSLSRLKRIREVDPLDYTITAEAGCVLQEVQQAAAEVDRLFPLSLAAEGSCEIGGNLSTNAGGIAVLRYGNARDLVLGLEVALPDGTIWNGLRRLRKDNRGYDLKQLFLGAEGTLGVITAAVLKLFPRPRGRVTALVPVPDRAATTRLLARCRQESGDLITSFEYIHRVCLDLVFRHIAGTSDPFARPYAHYVLLELASGRPQAEVQAVVESVLGEALEAGEALDGVIAASEEQAAQLWRLRETIPEAQKHAGGCIKHDISVPVSRVPAFLEEATEIAEGLVPGVRVAPFGHLGDGNIHFNLTQPEGADAEAFVALTDQVSGQIHDLAAAMDGSFSAEHGIGQLKRAELRRYMSEAEVELMAKLKALLDPNGIMNPGKVL
ncbi:MAG: FAD-binding oxidoreductase [Pseudomonadota bacterium]